MKDILSNLPVVQQRQDSVAEQLSDLRLVANRLGMYDAADLLGVLYDTDLATMKYGCHCDLEPNMKPDDCVIDSESYDDCVYAKKGMRKEQCEYWKIVT